MADGHEKWNNDEITSHLKSAVDTLTPNVLDRIDLNTPQMHCIEQPRSIKLYRKVRSLATAVAACLCVIALYGGVVHYQNTRVDSIIGLDVNPSIELSVNRKDKILKAEPLNDDAEMVLSEMELEGVELNIGVNAIIGSMVRCGYLDELDNAILVTVTNDDTEKASMLRQDVVTDIETSLETHKVNAVVYDQQAVDVQEIGEIAEQYGISYGKACFLYELVEENGLSEKELEAFADMTMEEIAQEISERSYLVGKNTGREEPSAATTAVQTETASESVTEENSSESSSQESQSGQSQTSAATSSSSAEAGTKEEEETGGKKAVVDYVDYYDEVLDIVFKEKVKWKNPTISVKDSNGVSYSAKITDTGPDSCSIEIDGLTGGESYTFILNGVKPRKDGFYGTVKGYFDVPDISSDAMGNEDEEENGSEEESSESSSETDAGQSTDREEESMDAQKESSSVSEPSSLSDPVVSSTERYLEAGGTATGRTGLMMEKKR